MNGLRKRRRNTIITSPQIYEDREIEIFVPRRARRYRAALSHAVQNIFNYGIIICCLCRGECAAAAGTDYINLISSSLTVSADPAASLLFRPLFYHVRTRLPLPPTFSLFLSVYSLRFSSRLARPSLQETYGCCARAPLHLCKYLREIYASTRRPAL